MDKIRQAMLSKYDKVDRAIDPPFPKIIQFAVTNRCNEKCIFCHLHQIERPQRHIDHYLTKRIMQEAHDAGAEQVGFTAGAEPTMNPYLPLLVLYAESIGFRYIFLTTNGTVYKRKELWDALLDAGLDSVKISINAGTPDTYELIHGKPYFDRAIQSVKWLNELKQQDYPGLYLAVSFVSCEQNREEENILYRMVGPLVDEFIFEKVNNQAGQMPQYTTAKLTGQCNQPWRTFVVSPEGYYRLCCGDMDNRCFVADLNRVSVTQAYDMGRTWRQRHITNDLKGTLCEQCLT